MGELQKLEQVLVKGDLSILSESERIAYYKKVCESTGLNPLTKPFGYITLNRQLTLYALKGASDQLRKIHNVDIKVTDKSIEDGIFYVTVEATDRSGRTDTDMGAVSIGGLKGEAKANAMLKTITKAKRRVTLSICGLGMLDETETESIPGAKPLKTANTPNQIAEKITLQQHGGQIEYKLSFYDGREEKFENKEDYVTRYASVLLDIIQSNLSSSKKIEKMQSFEDRNIANINIIDPKAAKELINKNKNYTKQILGEEDGENTINA